MTALHALPVLETLETACAHCGTPLQAVTEPGERFCCHGCAGAYALIHDLGLDQYYARRCLDPDVRAPRPVEDAADRSAFVRVGPDGMASLTVMVDGLQCAACVWLIEAVLAKLPGMHEGRVNMTTRRLRLTWEGGAEAWRRPVEAIERLGYRLIPFDPHSLKMARDRSGKALLRALAVAGFAAGNIMLLSIGIWAGAAQGMGHATRDLLHWVSALIALPAVAYAGQPFFQSAWAAVRNGYTNMDVPISIGVILATGMSLYQTAHGWEHAFFDGATMLLFFLLIGRAFDHHARGAARAVAEQLLTLRSTAVRVLGIGGMVTTLPADRVAVGDRILVAAGERIGVDGRIIDGTSALDTSLVTGETLPHRVQPGDIVHAGMLNLGAPLTCQATATGDGTLLAEIVRLMDVAESRRSRFVALADRVAKRYAPVVHLTALITFLGWFWGIGASWQEALSAAVAVLIITCPCALALAVPVVQVLASSRLMRRGVLLKSATALERLASVTDIVFDKTGTLTLGRPVLLNPEGYSADVLQQAAALARSSRHPLSRALVEVAGRGAAQDGVEEIAGAGLRWGADQGDYRLGSRIFCGVDPATVADDSASELWFAGPGAVPVRFVFDDPIRSDAVAVVTALRAQGYRLWLLSGDRPVAVAAVADALGISDWRGSATPAEKAAQLEAMRAEGCRVLMVGDGLNDAPALTAASVSISPSSAADIVQTAADLVFQGEKLGSVLLALDTGRAAQRLARENLIIALLYNLLAVPLAIAGVVTPLIAAAAMSSSSLLVIANSFRLARRRRPWTF
jgi:P-type Cu2+ transporter